MDEQQEIGGAHALLQLGSKQKDDGIDDSIDAIGNNENSNVNEDVDDEGDLSDSKNQQINDAVEAAVMRYVGGTLDSAEHESKRSKRKIHDEIINNIHEFNQWTGFLEENISDHGNEDYDAYTSQQQSQPLHLNKRSKGKKRRTQLGTSDIDPELEALGTTEHDQLVEAAIIDARELARHINEQGAGTGNLNLSHHQQHAGSDSINAITQLAQAATSLSETKKAKLKRKDGESYQMKNIALRPKFNNLTSVETLIEEASAQACEWFNSLPDTTGKGPRMFSAEEMSAVDHFVAGYCHLNKWTREDVCNRVWSNERKKDNFWESLVRVLPYRSRASVYKHVRRIYHVFDVRAKWTEEDDALLKKLALTHEGKWKQIGEAMGRMPEDCRDRWRNYVKCGDNRTSNQWSQDEENALKQIVTDMFQQSGNKEYASINWTVVSERMNGTRSRIQCRYKWNKLVKRETALRATYMNSDTKLWMLRKLQSSGWDSVDSVDWTEVARLHREENVKQDENGYQWDAPDFKASFEKMRSEVRDHKRLSFVTILMRLIEDLEGHPKLIAQHLRENKDNSNKLYYDRQNKTKNDKIVDPNDPESIATAAVAAVSSGVDGVDAQQQAYSLWR